MSNADWADRGNRVFISTYNRFPAAMVRGDAATVFVVDAGTARKRKVAVLGESGGTLFVSPALGASVRVVTEGRALLKDGDRVSDRLEAWTPPEDKAQPAEHQP